MGINVLKINALDNVAIAVAPLAEGVSVAVAGRNVTVREPIPRGHKLALKDIPQGSPVRKYGYAIGNAVQDIPAGSWIHSHNLATALRNEETYEYLPSVPRVSSPPPLLRPFDGYLREDGAVATRNELWVINTVGCVNSVAHRIAATAHERIKSGTIDGAHHFAHPYGCSQLGDDLRQTQRLLAGLIRHPNAGGVLILGLGCENNRMEQLLELVPDKDRSRLRFLMAQEAQDEFEEGLTLAAELAERMGRDRRTVRPASDLVLGMKCGGSDGMSGITANPLVGRIADGVTALGGTAILTEVPEMFGAERILMERAESREVFDGIVGMISRFKQYYLAHGQPVHENPSPGNKEGGITTLEEKSLGAIQKGGQAVVTSVLAYGERVRRRGLALLSAPGNDGVSSTALVASGATILLFTTGRGTPLGFPVPTVKISSNTELAEKKRSWIDFDAGRIAAVGMHATAAEQELLELLTAVASGKQKTRNEMHDVREIEIWKDGVTL